MARTILIVDDEESILQALEGILIDEGFEVLKAASGAAALEMIEASLPDLVLLDIWMPGLDGMQTLGKIKEAHPQQQVVMMSGHGNIDTAVKATKLGAHDFIEKPLDYQKLLLSINNALNYYRLEEEVSLLKEKERVKAEVSGNSSPVRALKKQIEIVAPTNAWVLISGENGTGKELVANMIHRLSKRSHKPLIEVNCAAIPEELIESELFGHEKGAFTGAATMKKGKFDLAHEGTLFLDEIGDMSLKAQSKTLRILQEQKFERVGGARTIRVDVRVIAATNKDLEKEIGKGTFRDDLYFRLNVIPMRVPPLRERLDDLPALVQEFLHEMTLDTALKVKNFSADALELLKKYHWPGNVRELRNLVERLVIMAPEQGIQARDIPSPYNMEAKVPEELAAYLRAETYKEAKMNFEKTYIAHKLREFNGNISQTAEAIGVERSHLHKKIKSYGL